VPALSLCFDILIGVSHQQRRAASAAERENLRTCGGGAVRAQNVCALSLLLSGGWMGGVVGWLVGWVAAVRPTLQRKCSQQKVRFQMSRGLALAKWI